MKLITCQHEWVKQCQLRYKVEPPIGYHFEDAHYPEPECRNGTETVRLWYPDHIVHGALQTFNLQHPCMHGYRVHAEREILLRVYPEYAELYEEAYSLCQTFAGRKGCSKAGKIGGKVTRERGVGIFDPAVRQESMERVHTEIYVGEKRSEAMKKRAKTIGVEKMRSFAEKLNSQVWKSTEDGFISTAGNVAQHNTKNGWDPNARIRIS
jgi:hypothetical protein